MTAPTGEPKGYVGAHRAPRLFPPVVLVVAVLVAAAVVGGLFAAGLALGSSGGGAGGSGGSGGPGGSADAGLASTASPAASGAESPTPAATDGASTPPATPGASGTDPGAPGADGSGTGGSGAGGSGADGSGAGGSGAGGSGAGADGSSAAAAVGPLAAGPHPWNALQGGECLSAYSSPWVEEFTVADCAVEHAAQVVTSGTFTDDPAAAYPGEAALVAQLNLLCTATAVLDYAVAAQYPDLAWQSSYPTDESQWISGDHRYYCFYARSSGEPLTGSLQPPA